MESAVETNLKKSPSNEAWKKTPDKQAWKHEK